MCSLFLLYKVEYCADIVLIFKKSGLNNVNLKQFCYTDL